MSLLDQIVRRLGYTKAGQDLQAPAWLRADADLARWSIPDGSVAYNQADLYRRLSWVQMAVSLTAGVAAGAQFSVKRRIGDNLKDIPNHDFEQLLQHPNPLMSRFELLEATFAYRALTGNAYWWLNRANPNSPPREIWAIPSHKILPIPDGQSYIRGYAFFPEGMTGSLLGTPPMLLEPWEVVHFRRFHPQNTYVGLSPIEALSTVAAGDLAAQQWNANFFGKENAKLPGFLAFADAINDSDWKKIKADVVEQSGGVRRMLMMLRNVGKGGVEWVQAGMSQKDMEFLGMRDFTKEEIFGLFAPGLSSLLSVNATEANATQGKATFIEFSVWPGLQAIGEKITNDVLPAYGPRLAGSFDDIRIVDRALKLQEQAAYERTHSIDEVRAEYYQDEPLADGRGAALLADGAPAAETPRADPANPVADQVAQALDQPPTQKAQIAEPGQGLSPDEEALFQALRSVLWRHSTEIADQIQAGQTLDYTRLSADLQAELQVALLQVLYSQMQAGLVEVGQDLDPDTFVPAASAWAQHYSFDLVKGLTTTTQTVVQTVLAQFLASSGMPRGQLVQLLQPAFSPRRAETIAITEVTRAAAEAKAQLQQHLASAGIVMERVWRTANDETMCTICAPMNGRSEIDWGGLSVPAHPRCRCSVTLRTPRGTV